MGRFEKCRLLRLPASGVIPCGLDIDTKENTGCVSWSTHMERAIFRVTLNKS